MAGVAGLGVRRSEAEGTSKTLEAELLRESLSKPELAGESKLRESKRVEREEVEGKRGNCVDVERRREMLG